MRKNIPIILAMVMPLLLAATPLESPRQKGELKNERMVKRPAVVRAPPVERVIVSWTYPLAVPRPGLVFDVEFRDNLRSGSWQKVGEVAAPPFAYTISGKKSGFFRIISRSTTNVTQSVTLAWDAPADLTGITSYRVYRGPVSRNYTNFISAASSPVTVSNVTSRTFFTATSRTSTGQESVYSNEVEYEPVATDPVYPVTQLTITTL